MPDRDTLTLDEAAAELGVSRRRLRDWIEEGRLPVIPPRPITVRRRDLEPLRQRPPAGRPKRSGLAAGQARSAAFPSALGASAIARPGAKYPGTDSASRWWVRRRRCDKNSPGLGPESL